MCSSAMSYANKKREYSDEECASSPLLSRHMVRFERRPVSKSKMAVKKDQVTAV